MKRPSRRFWIGIFVGLWVALPTKNLWAVEASKGITREVFWQGVSFVLLVILLIYFIKDPLRTYLKKRREEIKASLEQPLKKEEESQSHLSEWEEKINSLNLEINALHQKVRQEGEEEREKIIERAQVEGQRIREQARIFADQEVKKARLVLKKEMVDLSVELAEKLLKEVTRPEDQERLVKEYIGKVRGIR